MHSVNIVERTNIKLSPYKVRKFGKIFREYKNAPSQKLKARMIDIFAPQIELKAAEAAAKNNDISAVDYAQTLYLKFLKSVESVKKKQGYIVKTISEALDEVKPSKYDLKSFNFSGIEDITNKDYNNFSEEMDRETLAQKAEKIIDCTKGKLTDSETSVLSMFLEGKTFDEMDKMCNISAFKAETTYNSAIKKLNRPELKDKFNHILYEDAAPGRFLERVEDMPPEIIKTILNDIIKQNGYTNNCLFRKNISSKKSNLLDCTGMILKIELPKRYNTPEFRKAAEQISEERYGRNIFQFLN